MAREEKWGLPISAPDPVALGMLTLRDPGTQGIPSKARTRNATGFDSSRHQLQRSGASATKNGSLTPGTLTCTFLSAHRPQCGNAAMKNAAKARACVDRWLRVDGGREWLLLSACMYARRSCSMQNQVPMKLRAMLRSVVLQRSKWHCRCRNLWLAVFAHSKQDWHCWDAGSKASKHSTSGKKRRHSSGVCSKIARRCPEQTASEWRAAAKQLFWQRARIGDRCAESQHRSSEPQALACG